MKYLQLTPRGSPSSSARGSTTNIFDKYKIQDKKVNPKFMKAMFDKEVNGSGTDLAEDVETKPKFNINNVHINNMDPLDEEISEEKMRYVDSIINKVTTAHRSSPSMPRKESAEDLQRLNEEKSHGPIENLTENNTNKSESIDIKKEEKREEKEVQSLSPEKENKLDWSSLKFNDLQIEISNCGNIIFEPPVSEDEAVSSNKIRTMLHDTNWIIHRKWSRSSTKTSFLTKSSQWTRKCYSSQIWHLEYKISTFRLTLT